MSLACSLKLRLRQLLFKKSEKILYLKAMVHLEIVILFLIGSAMQVYSTTMEIPNPLNGKHLLIHALEVCRLFKFTHGLFIWYGAWTTLSWTVLSHI